MIDEKYLVLEFCNCGDLYSYFIKDRLPITTREELLEAVSLCSHIAKGMRFLEDLGFTHRDLKPENVLIQRDIHKDTLTAKIADFGLCKQSNMLKSIVGTPNYIAPEILDVESTTDKLYTNAVDVWSFGLLLYETITKKQIFRGKTQQEIVTSIKLFSKKVNIAALEENTEENCRINKLIGLCL